MYCKKFITFVMAFDLLRIQPDSCHPSHYIRRYVPPKLKLDFYACINHAIELF